MIQINLDCDTKLREDFLDFFNNPDYASLSKDELFINYFNSLDKLTNKNPSKVFLSKEIENNQFFINNIETINKIKQNFEDGNNIELNKRLSKRSTIAHEQDLLLNNWKIHHFHLGDTIENNFYQRTNELLFVKIEDNITYFLDIKEHNNFSSIDFLKIIHNNWSNIIEHYLIKDIINIEPKPSESEIMELWKNGIQHAVTFIDNTNKEVSYLPIGGGTNVNNQSFNNIQLLTRINRDCYNIESFIEKNKTELQIFIKENQKIKTTYNVLNFFLKFNTDNNYFYLHESQSSLNFSWQDSQLILLDDI